MKLVQEKEGKEHARVLVKAEEETVGRDYEDGKYMDENEAEQERYNVPINLK